MLGGRRVDSITADDVAAPVQALVSGGKKRETIRKTTTYLAAVCDHYGIEPNPVRDIRVRLPVG